MGQGPFNGIAKAHSRIFGGPVTILPEAGGSLEIRAIFRKVPYQFLAENGAEVQTVRPVLRAIRSDADQIFVGDQVDPRDGAVYEVISVGEPESPADDALVPITLEEAGA